MKNIIITGSSNGFGYLAAKSFADNGYKVWATMRNSDTKNKQKKEELESYSTNIKVLNMDVTDEESVSKTMSNIIAEDGKVDVLLNNAGIMYIGITEAYSTQQAQQQMDVNYLGAVRTTQAVLPVMRAAGRGLIINTSSVAGRLSQPFFGTYNASKFALEGYTQALKYEVAPTGVEVVLVEPGPFGTGLIDSIQPESRKDILDDYSELVELKTTMMSQFEQFLSSEEAPQPQMVVDAYLQLAEMPVGTRPSRTVVGIDWGASELNKVAQPIQDASLESLQMSFLLDTKV